ncbi:CYP4B1 [Mytilus coruscus]|uniref:CYP4B1 n=1 Tax=Mytilus coruscus TaxID=42192 RepID=A0A6J8C686_MYTCO|nr:CYP4B1 [Mytilus coruscus]
MLTGEVCRGNKNGKYVEVFQHSGLAKLDILLQCALSYKGNIQDVGNINLYPEFLFKRSPSGKEFFKLCDFVHEFSEDVIYKRKELKESSETKKKRQLDFLDILLKARDESSKGLTDEEIRSEVDTFMFAGHDTTSSVLSWSIHSLGKHKDIQDKVYKEVNGVIGNKQYVDCEDISKMKHLSCFLKEIMRHHTPVPVISRMLDEPCVIEGVELPSGTFIDMAIHHAHHHPDVWEDPWEFKPEKFVGDKHHDMDPYSFTPFSAGPRFEITVDPVHEVEHFIEVVMRAKNGIMATLNKEEEPVPEEVAQVVNRGRRGNRRRAALELQQADQPVEPNNQPPPQKQLKTTAVQAGPGNTFNNTGSLLMPCANEIDIIVSQQIKEKIWNFEYVDFGTLLKQNSQYYSNLDQKQSVTVENGMLVISNKPLKVNTINNIELWTEAFANFSKILLQKDASLAQDLFTYMSIIRDAISNAPFDSYQYDRQLRLRVSLNHSKSWSEIDGFFDCNSLQRDRKARLIL